MIDTNKNSFFYLDNINKDINKYTVIVLTITKIYSESYKKKRVRYQSVKLSNG